MSDKVFAIVTERLIAQIEAGTCPWRKPWKGGSCPQNLLTGRAYSGFNRLATSGFERPYFATFKQLSSEGLMLRKGARSVPIVWWMRHEKEKDGKKDSWLSPRFYKVFNVDDLEASSRLDDLMAKRRTENDNLPRPDADSVVRKTGANISYGNGAAYYIPSKDRIEMPALGQFDAPNSFYGTLFHELGHWTGHETRLKREGITTPHAFGSENYSKEELVAELTSAFVCESLGINGNLESSAAYLDNWLRKLKEEPKMLLTSATAAQKAANLILGDAAKQEGAEE